MGARERILKLVDGVRTVKQISELAFADYGHTSRVLRQMHSAGQVHIASMVRQTTRPLIIYGAGPGPDDVRSFKTKSTDRLHLMFERMSADDRDRYRNRQNTKRRKIKVDPLTAAFFGAKR